MQVVPCISSQRLFEPYIALSCPRWMRSRQQERTDLFIFSFSMLHEIFIDYDLLPSVIFRFSGSDFREERARMSVDTSRSAVFVCKRLRIALFRTHMLVVWWGWTLPRRAHDASQHARSGSATRFFVARHFCLSEDKSKVWLVLVLFSFLWWWKVFSLDGRTGVEGSAC